MASNASDSKMKINISLFFSIMACSVTAAAMQCVLNQNHVVLMSRQKCRYVGDSLATGVSHYVVSQLISPAAEKL